jgi:predicted N-acyltransferase
MDEFRSTKEARLKKDAQVSMSAGLEERDVGLSVHWHASLGEIPTDEWDELARAAPGGTPFLLHAVLSAFIDSGGACVDTGWQPRFLTLRNDAGRVLAGCPVFLKHHSHGEYVFDWAWADAHDRALNEQGLHYYPKLLSAVPFSPIPGERLLVHPSLDAASRLVARQRLLWALTDHCAAHKLSSAHVLFLSQDEAQKAEAQGWLVRHGVQFHWQNRPGRPYENFEDFLASLQRDKRKKIQQERRKVREAGIEFEVLAGERIQAGDWDFFHRCYSQTYLERGQHPYLSRDFWTLAMQAAPSSWVLFIARHEGRRVAAALLAVDPVSRIAYGRYWGALAQLSCLHFEACYYQPLNWCIDNLYQRFEGGAQGEHKLTRGLLPVNTQSAHWLQHEGLREAVSNFLKREKQGVASYIDELDERSPFKPQDHGP